MGIPRKPLSELSYTRFHANLAADRGQAYKFNCIKGCGRKAYEWAHRHGTDKYDFNNYDPMCRFCHREYDASTPEARQNKSRAMVKVWEERHAIRATP